MEDIIRKNYQYFKENILPYYILVYTNQGVIVVDSSELNLKHLLGMHKTSNIKYSRMSSIYLWDYLENDGYISLFELIDKNRFEDNTLSTDELFLYRRNIGFIPIFESLFHQTNLNFYRKNIGDDFDTDYVQFCYYNHLGGYLGIIGSDRNNYHYFNSIMLEYDNPEKHIGVKVIVKKVERIKKDDFKNTDYKIIPSKRFVKKQKQHKPKIEKPQIKKELNNNDRKIINQLLKNNLKIDKGEFGKKSIKIIKDGKVLERGIKLNFTDLDTNKKIAEHINNKYRKM